MDTKTEIKMNADTGTDTNTNPAPHLSIVTVNYNGLADTCELIESLELHLVFPYEVIVVDNASVVDEAALIQARFPQVRCIRSERNLGFAGGNNVGIKVAIGECVLLLNNDTYVKDSSLVCLMELLRSHPTIGAVSPKIKFAQFPDEIQFAGYTALSSITLRNRTIGFGEKDRGQYNKATATSLLHGAAMMVRRDVLLKAGDLPDIYFLYYEELDWCQRIKEAGYELWYQPACTIYHKESKSVGRNSPLKSFYLTRNRLLFARRNRKGVNLLLTISYQLLLALPKNTLVSLAMGRADLAKAAWKGAWDFCGLIFRA